MLYQYSEGLNYGYVSSVSGYTGTDEGRDLHRRGGPGADRKIHVCPSLYGAACSAAYEKKENSQVSKDELPVSGGGKTITTVEPKFVPAKAKQK